MGAELASNGRPDDSWWVPDHAGLPAFVETVDLVPGPRLALLPAARVMHSEVVRRSQIGPAPSPQPSRRYDQNVEVAQRLERGVDGGC